MIRKSDGIIHSNKLIALSNKWSSLFFGVKAFGGHATNWYEMKPDGLSSGQMIARIFLS